MTPPSVQASTRPQSSAVATSSVLSARHISRVLCRPMRRGIDTVPPLPGKRPIATSGRRQVVPGSQTTRAAKDDNSTPAPITLPCTCAVSRPALSATQPQIVAVQRVGVGAEFRKIAADAEMPPQPVQTDGGPRCPRGREGVAKLGPQCGVDGIAPHAPVEGQPDPGLVLPDQNQRRRPRAGRSRPKRRACVVMAPVFGPGLQHPIGHALQGEGMANRQRFRRPQKLRQNAGGMRRRHHGSADRRPIGLDGLQVDPPGKRGLRPGQLRGQGRDDRNLRQKIDFSPRLSPRGRVRLDDDKGRQVLPDPGRMPRLQFRKPDRLRADGRLVLSRTHPGLPCSASPMRNAGRPIRTIIPREKKGWR